MLNFFQKWKLRKRATHFWGLLQKQEFTAALTWYDQELKTHEADLPKPVRAAYHFFRWVARRNNDDLAAVRLLASTAETGSAVASTWEALSRLQLQCDLAAALRQRGDPPSRGKGHSFGSSEEDATARLGWAALEGSRLESTAPESKKEAVAQTISKLLPPAKDLPESLRPVHAILAFWSLCSRGQFQTACKAHDSLARLPEDQKVSAELGALGAWFWQASLEGRMEDAAVILAQTAKVVSSEKCQSLALAWGVRALENNLTESAVKWFRLLCEDQAATTPSAESAAPQTFALAVSYLKQGRLGQGRQLLEQFQETEASPLAWRAMAVNLMVFSILSDTNDWPTVSTGSLNEPTVANAEAIHETLLRNRALWRAANTQIAPLIQRLVDWHYPRAALLQGLLAYVDSSMILNLDQVREFSAAVEETQSAAARERLHGVLAVLLTRAKATEEAISLLRAGDISGLRRMKDTVLVSLGDAIPSLVRAAVYLSLWRADPQYDPLPDLQALPNGPDEAALLNSAILQVHISNALTRLAQACARPGTPDDPLPSMGLFESFDRTVAQRAALALAVIHLRRGDPAAATRVLPESVDAADAALRGTLGFYAAWRNDDLDTCRFLARDFQLGRTENVSAGLNGRCLLHALRQNQMQQTWSHLNQAGEERQSRLGLSAILVCAVVWLLEHNEAELADRLLLVVRDERRWLALATVPEEDALLYWTWTVLSGFTSARLGRFTACMEAAERHAKLALPSETPFGSDDFARGVADWLQLFRLLAQLGISVSSQGDSQNRWRLAQRSLEAQAAEIQDRPRIQPYVFLLTGLLSYLSSDTLVDDALLGRLRKAQDALPPGKRAAFIEDVIGKLDLRRQIVADFWRGLEVGDLRRSREIYNGELAPAFGDRMPYSIRVGMILVDWDEGRVPSEELQRRLAMLQHDASETNKALLDRVREYLRDGDKVRLIVRLLRERNFGELIDVADQATWLDMERGSMPVAVAAAKLYACFKTQRLQNATEMGQNMIDTPGLQFWVKEYSALIVGYTAFSQQDFATAATAFEQVRTSELLKHDIVRYWEAAQFSQGMQLLEVGQKSQAFDAFARSTSKRSGGEAQNSRLSLLFAHFGLANLLSQQGARALRAFELMRQSVEDQEPTPEIEITRLLADMGSLLCECLMEEDVQELHGGGFLDLLETLEQAATASPHQLHKPLARTLRILAICQELRRNCRLPANKRDKPSELDNFIQKQVKTLDALQAEIKQQDPVLLTLKGVVELLLARKGDLNEAVDWIEAAVRLGVHSQRLAELLDGVKEEAKRALAKRKSALDLFDAYLLNGAVPGNLREQFSRRDDLAELYRLHRHYAPDELLVAETKGGVGLFCKRLDDLAAFIQSHDFAAEAGELEGQAAKLRDGAMRLRAAENELTALETELLARVAGKLQTQSVNPPPPI